MNNNNDNLSSESVINDFMKELDQMKQKNPVFSPKEYSIRAKDSASTIYSLPERVINTIDELAMLVFPPGNGKVLLTGSQMSGKTFLVDQLVANRTTYCNLSGLNNSPIFYRVDQGDVSAPWNEKFSAFLNEEININGRELDEIIFYTESPDVAVNLSYNYPEVRVILELSFPTLNRIFQIENAGASKLWSNWEVFDADEFFYNKREIIDCLAKVTLPEINRKNNKVRQITRKDISSLLTFIFKKFPDLMDEDGETDYPIAKFARLLRIFAGHLIYYSSRHANLSNSEILGKALEAIHLIMHKELHYHGEDDEENDSFLENVEEMMKDFVSQPGTQRKTSNKPTQSAKFSDFSTLENRINRTLKGQELPVKDVVNSLSIAEAGLGDPEKPLRTFLFMGPTGVGKTQLAKILQNELYTTKVNLIQLDMSEYQEKHEVSKLFGSPPGYVGHETGGLLTNAVLKNPYSILLLDEAEKAHPKIWETFLQVFDSGKLTDSSGKVADFSKCVIIMTSNLGVKDAISKDLGFGNFGGGSYKDRQSTMKSSSNKAMTDFFSPEFLNRIDSVIHFNELPKDVISEILQQEIGIISSRMKGKGFILEDLSEEVLDQLMKNADISKYGARELQRIVQKQVAVPIAGIMREKNSVKTICLKINTDGIIQASTAKKRGTVQNG